VCSTTPGRCVRLHLAGVSDYTWQVCPITPGRCVRLHLAGVSDCTWQVCSTTPGRCVRLYLAGVFDYTWQVCPTTPGRCVRLHLAGVFDYTWPVCSITPGRCVRLYLAGVFDYTWQVCSTTPGRCVRLYLTGVFDYSWLVSWVSIYPYSHYRELRTQISTTISSHVFTHAYLTTIHIYISPLFIVMYQSWIRHRPFTNIKQTYHTTYMENFIEPAHQDAGIYPHWLHVNSRVGPNES